MEMRWLTNLRTGLCIRAASSTYVGTRHQIYFLIPCCVPLAKMYGELTCSRAAHVPPPPSLDEHSHLGRISRNDDILTVRIISHEEWYEEYSHQGSGPVHAGK